MKLKDLLKNVQDVELTPEQEKQIKDYLGIKDNKRFIPIEGEQYYYILSDGSNGYTYYEPNLCVDNQRILIGNCFRTKDDAKFTVEKIKVYQELKNFADENNDPIDWKKSDFNKVCICYNHTASRIEFSCHQYTDVLGTFYFSSKELAEQAIQKVGKDRIKKYLFGVE